MKIICFFPRTRRKKHECVCVNREREKGKTLNSDMRFVKKFRFLTSQRKVAF